MVTATKARVRAVAVNLYRHATQNYCHVFIARLVELVGGVETWHCNLNSLGEDYIGHNPRDHLNAVRGAFLSV